ncbi:MAG TPA: TonB-dependent receptor [Thermoanaerobaculia bacterium]|nr:TonB-dependent receptor [Thermoanaerobaculia bacterium]
MPSGEVAQQSSGLFAESVLRIVAIFATAFLLSLPARAETRGRVTTVTGDAIAGALVEILSDGNSQSTTSDERGFFVLPSDPPLMLRVSAPALTSRDVQVQDEAELSIVLVPFGASASITVTATRTGVRAADVPISSVTVSHQELDSAASPAVDDALRGVPGFGLFRRSGSRSANPTSQGVSLRGVGASGASRSAVLDDGVPLNDAFGGWVYWGRVPVAAIDRIEVIRGGASDLFGGSASSGVIQLVRRSGDQHFVADVSLGADSSSRVSLSAAELVGAVTLRLDMERFATDGYTPVRREERGAVDIASNVERKVLDLAVSHQNEDALRSFARLSYFDEGRSNGTALQKNATQLLSVAAGVDLPVAGRALASLRTFATSQTYEQTFSAIASDRSSERLTLRQEVPSRSAGISGHATAQLSSSSTLVVGAEGRSVKGASNEEVYVGSSVIARSAGGTQRIASLFVEDVTRLASALTLVASVRFDSWSNSDASRRNAGAVTRLIDQRSSALSPRVGIAFRVAKPLTLTSSVYDAFRAPTLNELYRSFRVGDVVTNANEELDAERLRGYELGARWEMTGAALRANAFSMTTSELIGNVTLTSTPSLITRQRRNIGKSRTNGIEVDAEWQPVPALRLTSGYLFTQAEVVSFAASPDLVGNRLPQVPQHQGSFRVSYSGLPGAMLVSDVRWSGSAFEDDRNQLPLASYRTIDLSASRLLRKRWTGYIAIENLLGEEIEVGRTPITTLGQPRSWRLGIRTAR